MKAMARSTPSLGGREGECACEEGERERGREGRREGVGRVQVHIKFS